jgi:MFS family permease
MIVLLQLPSTRIASRFLPQTVIAVTSNVIGTGFALLALAHTTLLLAGAVAVWSLGELTQWPVAAAYTINLAPAGLTGRYAGTRSLAYGLALLVAPLVGTALYSLDPAALWLACAAAGGVTAAIMTWPRDKQTAAPRPHQAARTASRPAAARSTRYHLHHPSRSARPRNRSLTRTN